MDLVLIGGVSGSGKSVALAALEDSGYYAVGNLPVALRRPTVDHLARAGAGRAIAIALDAKSGPGLAGPADGDRRAASRAAGTCASSFSTRRPRRWSSAFPRRAAAIRSRATTRTLRRGDRVRARAARRRALARHRVRHQRPAGRGAAQLGQGLRQRRSVAADAAVRVVRLQARRPARRRPRVRRALPAESALRAARSRR